MQRGRRRRLVALAIVVLAPVVVELALRGAAALAGQERGMGFDPDLGWRPLPGVARRGPMWGRDEPARTNSRGWRDVERELAPPPGVTRIVALGDSFTFGIGVDDGERFTDRLEEVCPGVEVLNMGVNAYGPDQELIALEREALAYRPDVVVVTTFLGNDLDDLRWKVRNRWPKPYFRIVDGELVHHPPQPGLGLALRTSTYLGELVHLAWSKLLDTPSRIASGEEGGAPLYLALVERMAAATRAGGAELLVVLVYDAGGRTRVHETIVAELERAGIATLDTLELMWTGAPAGVELYNPPPVGHWSPAGHERIAIALRDRLRELGWLP